MNLKITDTLSKILEFFASSSIIDGVNKQNVVIGERYEQTLLEITNDALITPVGDVLPLMLANSDNSHDQPIDWEKLTLLVKTLNNANSLIRLNHIGFCYQVESNKKEKQRLLSSLENENLHFYEESNESSDVWLFLGDVSRWEDTTLEYVIIENTSDPEKEYWLPHIQLDMDTTLSTDEINEVIKSVYSDSIKPFPIVIDEVTYIMRCWLGRVGGINIFLDLATNKRNVKFLKHNIWKEVK